MLVRTSLSLFNVLAYDHFFFAHRSSTLRRLTRTLEQRPADELEICWRFAGDSLEILQRCAGGEQLRADSLPPSNRRVSCELRWLRMGAASRTQSAVYISLGDDRILICIAWHSPTIVSHDREHLLAPYLGFKSPLRSP